MEKCYQEKEQSALVVLRLKNGIKVDPTPFFVEQGGSESGPSSSGKLPDRHWLIFTLKF